MLLSKLNLTNVKTDASTKTGLDREGMRMRTGLRAGFGAYLNYNP